MANKKQLANLRPELAKEYQFQKGKSGNPKGRPKKEFTVTSLLKQDLEVIDKRTGKTKAQMVAEKIVQLAIDGDIRAIEEILNRVDGKVPQALQHEGKGGTAPVFNIIVQSESAKYKLNQIMSGTRELPGVGIDSTK